MGATIKRCLTVAHACLSARIASGARGASSTLAHAAVDGLILVVPVVILAVAHAVAIVTASVVATVAITAAITVAIPATFAHLRTLGKLIDALIHLLAYFEELLRLVFQLVFLLGADFDYITHSYLSLGDLREPPPLNALASIS